MRLALWPDENGSWHADEVVAYLEGWYVVPDARQGCTEFGSDALLDNELSVVAHRALGFEEVERIMCFQKDLAKLVTEWDAFTVHSGPYHEAGKAVVVELRNTGTYKETGSYFQDIMGVRSAV